MLSFILTLALGGVAGWAAGKLMDTEGSMLRNIILGLLGGVVGSIVLGLIGISGSGIIGGTLVSIVGACILIWLSQKFL